ncbi:MAG: FMN-binding protein [Oscillospiraceae bacterium]
MILGIITAAVFVLVSAIFFTQKLKDDSQVKKLFAVIHKPLGYLLVALAVVHLAITLPLIRQRPFIIYLLGIGMVTCTMAAIIVRCHMEDKRKAFAWHKLCALAIALLLILHVVFCVTSFSEYKRNVAAIAFSNPDISSVADGEYTGECDAGYIFAKVNVTVIDGVITNIDLLEHRNERGKAGEGVIDEILSEQCTDVDAVSGATNSSRVIKKAVENALEKGINR